MIIFRLMGGLGNQMFAYAAGRSLETQRQLTVNFDFDCPYPHIAYEYALDVFALTPRPASPADLRRLKPARGLRRRLLHALNLPTDPHAVNERQEFTYDPDFLSMPDERYATGYWQSEKYFAAVAPRVRHDFAFRHQPSAQNAALIAQMRTHASVSVHVRRGDYVSVAKTTATHGLCSVDYYRRGFEAIERAIPSPVYYFFSNDIPWVRANLTPRHEHHFVDHNTGANSYEDLRLMSHCRHHIIANSSFSWWGAWLNPDPDKMVVAPRKWMADVATPDILPTTWMAL